MKKHKISLPQYISNYIPLRSISTLCALQQMSKPEATLMETGIVVFATKQSVSQSDHHQDWSTLQS